jgi:hypothetical protein
MVKVSNLFKSKIYGQERTIQAKVSFEILDIAAYEDAAFSVTDEAPISRLSQSINKIREMSHKYATFERDYFLLDGNSYIPPRENEGDSELGWWGDILSGADGTFAVSPAMEFTFATPHSSIGLTLTFDTLSNEYPTDFLIEAFDPTETPILSQTITGNSSAIYFFETPLENYQRIKITLLKWSKPSRRAKIVEVDFGIVREYTGEKLISLKIVEEMDLLSSTVPSNEMQFVLDNSDNTFNILNPNGIYKFLKTNQEMSAEIGLLIGEEKYEYLTMGKYFLTDWTVEEGSMTSKFVGRDIFTKLGVIDYTNLLQNTNLYDLAVDILTQANVESYSIAEELKLITTVGFTKVIKAREALQMIAIAGRSVVRQGRDGALIIEQFEELAFETGYVTWTGQEIASTVPQVYIDYTFQAIDFETAFNAPKLSLSQQVTHLVFKLEQPPDAEGNVVMLEAKYTNPNVREGIGYEITNPLITTEAQAALVAEWMFREYSFIADYQASWRQNPALECGNIILIEDSFGNKKKARITKQEYNFEGYLEGMTDAKGGI